MQTTELIPDLLQAFRSEIAIFRHLQPTDQNKAAAAELIRQYATRLQLLDLTLSEADARQQLKNAYLKG